MGTSRSLGLRPVMTLGARLVQVKRLPAGHGISYGHEYVTDRETTVALVPVGYADGIDRSATNAGPVLAAGRVRPIAGRVCMDQFVLDLGDDLAVAATRGGCSVRAVAANRAPRIGRGSVTRSRTRSSPESAPEFSGYFEEESDRD